MRWPRRDRPRDRLTAEDKRGLTPLFWAHPLRRGPTRHGPPPGPARGHRTGGAVTPAAAPRPQRTPARRKAPPARPRRPPGGGPRLPAALLVTLVRAGVHGARRPSRPPGLGLRPTRRVHRVDRLVPLRRRSGRPVGRRAAAAAGRPDRHADDGAVARPRPALPGGVVRHLHGVGHFTPLESPGELAAALIKAVTTARSPDATPARRARRSARP